MIAIRGGKRNPACVDFFGRTGYEVASKEDLR
jgi:hypothetical protein